MIGLHLQDPIPDWPDAVAQAAPGTWHKFFQVEACSEAKARRPDCRTIYRHHVDHQDAFIWAPDLYQAARDFFTRFIDGTFEQHAANVDAVEELNEYYATGDDPDTMAQKISWSRAVMQVWANEYRPRFPHIRLVVANTAIGNDIPVSVAEVAYNTGAILSYHAYTPVHGGAVLAGEAPYYSQRWQAMDQRFTAHGYYCDWLLTEVGPVGYSVWPNGDVALHAFDGWRHADVCGGDVASMTAALESLVAGMASFNAAHGGRCLGGQFFTSNVHSGWEYFRLAQPEAGAVMAHFAAWQPPITPPDPEPEPVTLEYRPCDTEFITQVFGARPDAYAPLPGHDGLDYAAPYGAPIWAAEAGEVLHASEWRWSSNTLSAYGYHVVIQHSDYATVYAHLRPPLLVLPGDIVEAGELLGWVGDRETSGENSTGPHLHLGLLDQSGLRQPFNGYPEWVFGRVIDPMFYVEGLPTPDTDPEPPIDAVFAAAVWEESIDQQTIQLNPDAALQGRMLGDGFSPVSGEFWMEDDDGTEYACHAAERLDDGARRVYMAEVPHWGHVWYITG